MEINQIYQGDCLEVVRTFPSESIDMVITSPPYWALRDYGVDGQLGLEPTPDEYIDKLCNVFDEVYRVLKRNGTCWVNLGDTYNGNKQGKTDNKVCDYLKNKSGGIKKKRNCWPVKSLLQIPSRFSIEMCNRRWILRNEIIWHKPNAMPSSVKDRFTMDHEKLFFFTKSRKYYFCQQLEKSTYAERDYRSKIDGGVKHKHGKSVNVRYSINRTAYTNGEYKNKRTVWTITTKPFKEAHFAVYPPELIETPIKAGCPENGIVLDPFMGSGTTGLVAKKLNRNFVGIELNPEYIKIAEKRLGA